MNYLLGGILPMFNDKSDSLDDFEQKVKKVLIKEGLINN